MSRLVKHRQYMTVRLDGGSVQTLDTGDNYSARVAKYIPGEALATFMAIDKILRQGIDPQTIPIQRTVGEIIMITIILLGNAVYLRRLGGPGAFWLTCGIQSLAFLIWVYTLPGLALQSLYDSVTAGAIAVTFTFLAGTIGATSSGQPTISATAPTGQTLPTPINLPPRR